ncbi:GNAT family N-acetyltransferase [Bacillus sp. FJAT-49682]|uniref:GNAT family N-acetyltransferase n=2 Tax=Lederbergia citrea TaxID=2833581 RepID=A0A942UUG5_9BACI|nr:GNAT family N-acetyltransferase [Lederbergia citrea]MBS4223119.1 GNAT family N-acetyltransferase [Lederbergia citrea]
MTVRKATQRETQKILQHSEKVMEEATMGYVKPQKDKAYQMVLSYFDEGGFYLVYAKNNNIQGWIGIGRAMDSFADEMVGLIFEIFVLPKYRKQGIAEKLFFEAFEYLKEEGCKIVQLNVFAENPAKHLYQKLGFREISTIMERQL